MAKTKQKINETSEKTIKLNADPEHIKGELGKLYFIKWIAIGIPIISVGLTAIDFFYYSIAAILFLASALLLILSVKKPEIAFKIEGFFTKEPRGESLLLVVAALVFTFLVSIVLAGITDIIKLSISSVM